MAVLTACAHPAPLAIAPPKPAAAPPAVPDRQREGVPISAMALPPERPLRAVDQLDISSPTGADPGGGDLYDEIVLVNHGPTCCLRGHPLLTSVDWAGHVVTTARKFLGNANVPDRYATDAPQTIQLETGHAASTMQNSVFTARGGRPASCPAYTDTRIALPGGGPTNHVPDVFLDGDMHLWRCHITIGPLVAGAYRFPGNRFDLPGVAPADK